MQTEQEYAIGKEISALRCESVGEYSLPDYNGDVKKVLLVKNQVYPTGKFVGEDVLEFSGTVGYEVVYIDGENNVAHAEFSTDYDAAIKINSESYIDSDIKSNVSSCNMRLIGPRKLSVKCTLDHDVHISERRTHSVDGDAFIEYEPEYISESAEVLTSGFSLGETRDIKEDVLKIDGAIADEVEILLSDVKGKVDVSEMTGGNATLDGCLKVNLLYKNDENKILSVVKEIPYTDTLPLDSAYEYDVVSARLDLVEKKCTVMPDEDGVTLSVSLSVSPKIYGKKNSRIDLVADAYLKERGTENEYSDFVYTEHIRTERCETKFDAKRSFDELETENISAIFYTDAVAKVENCEMRDGTVKISGEIRFNGIACQVLENDGNNYVPVKFAAQFEQNVNTNCQICDNMRVNCSVSAEDVRMEIVDNAVIATCVLCSSVNVVSDKKRRCLGSSYATDEEYARDDSVVTVYYPDTSESLFEIAKKFHTSVGNIAECNRLSESVFSSSRQPLSGAGVKKLIIK